MKINEILLNEAVLGVDEYDWYEYTSKKPATIHRKNKLYTFVPGLVFGIRASSSGNAVRLIFKELGPSIVFTIDRGELKTLTSNAKSIHTPGKEAEQADAEAWEDEKEDWYYKNVHPLIIKAMKKAKAAKFNPEAGKWLKKLSNMYFDETLEDALDDGRKAAEKFLEKLRKAVDAPIPGIPVKMSKEPGVAKFAPMIWNTIDRFIDRVSMIDADAWDLLGMHVADGADCLTIATKFAATGNSNKLEDLISGMDTDAREEIPDAVFNWLGKY